ncbi:MAG TPA: ABC transporter ATP-binding protein [Ktedonobacterales bacterium]|nr:ABC transporter ATP-binding protein [Ktedonobacterales bacterium]
MEIAVSCRGLTKRYGDVLALDALTLDVPTGAIYGVLGPNGAGKTTLLRLLTGLARPTSGEATVAGLSVSAQAATMHQRISFLDQSPQYYSWMSGHELVTFVGELFGLRGAELCTRVDEVLALTGLSDVARRRIGGYSGGMRQRLGLAQALVNRPDVLFLDEPASALDPAGRHEILTTIAGLRGVATVCMSTHILADVERVCDTVAILNEGRLIVSASVADLQARYAQPAFELELEAGQADAAEQLVVDVRAQPWTDEVVRQGDLVRVLAVDTAAAGRELLPLVTARGVQLRRFERVRPDIEDIFLRLTVAPAASIPEKAQAS